jgi:carbon-monoxide dehydrogenase medium subunit
MYAFDYKRPGTLAEADLAMKATAGAKLLAGGMTLIPAMKLRLASHEAIVDLSGIAALHGIVRKGNALVIGAMTTHAAVAESAEVRAAIPGLASVAEGIGDPHVRNRGTMGGSLANNDPAADYPGAALALGATIQTNKRTIAADDFFTGLFSTALDDGEIITEITFPVPQSFTYVKMPNPASRYSLVGVAVARTGGGVRVAVTGAGSSGAYRWTEAETALAGNFSAKALDGLKVDPAAMMSDMHAAADYRAHLVSVIAKRAVSA